MVANTQYAKCINPSKSHSAFAQICNIESEKAKGSEYGAKNLFFFWSFRNKGLGGPRYNIYIYIHTGMFIQVIEHVDQAGFRA